MSVNTKQLKWLAGLAVATAGVMLLVVGPIWLFFGTSRSYGDDYGSIYGIENIVSQTRLDHLGIAVAAMVMLWRAGRYRVAAAGAAAVCLLCIAVLLTMVWFERRWWAPMLVDSLLLRWGVAALFLWSIPLAGVAVIGATRFDGAMAAMRWLGMAVVCVPPAMLTLAYFSGNTGSEFRHDPWPTIWRVAMTAQIGALAVLPILHLRRSAREQDVRKESSELRVPLSCPRCKELQTVPVGWSKCTKCRLSFTIEVEEPRCPACRYLLYNLTAPRCPECGVDLPAHESAADKA